MGAMERFWKVKKNPEQSVTGGIKGPSSSEDCVVMKSPTTLWPSLCDVVIFEETIETLKPRTNLSIGKPPGLRISLLYNVQVSRYFVIIFKKKRSCYSVKILTFHIIML